MSKDKTNNLKQINVTVLRVNNLLSGGVLAHILWGDNSSIKVWVPPHVGYVELSYQVEKSLTQEIINSNYKINLLKTSCFFGGFRFWFECPGVIDGIPCKKRVAILYQKEELFVCRHCNNLAYPVQNLSGLNKIMGKKINNRPEITDWKYLYYKGKPTKRYLKLLKKESQADRAYAKGLEILNKRIEKVIQINK